VAEQDDNHDEIAPELMDRATHIAREVMTRRRLAEGQPVISIKVEGPTGSTGWVVLGDEKVTLLCNGREVVQVTADNIKVADWALSTAIRPAD
jgi:hypothetical protein